MPAKYIEHGFVIEKARPSVTLEFTARELEELEEQERQALKVRRLATSTVKVPLGVDINDLKEVADALYEEEASRRRAALTAAPSQGSCGNGHKVKLSLGPELSRYLKVRAAQEGRTASAVAVELLRAAISSVKKEG